MRKQLFFLVVLVCLFSGQTFSQGRTARPNKSPISAAAITAATPDLNNVNQLPIRRVVLYSNGVAYIERHGLVSGNAEINFSFKQSQVDDVLKSMVVLDLGQGRIGAVSYNSSAPPSARMAEIPFSVEAESRNAGGITGVLSQLQGARVTVISSRGAATGSILTVEKREVKTEKSTTTTTILVLVSETGEISSFDLADVRSVKLLDEGTRRDVNEFAKASASARRRDAKTISVTSEGTGQREMIVSYTIAAPIWKTTYRVVLDEQGKPFFQGWAIVDNVSDEDWRNVQLSLVSGTPVSFIQHIQKPVYRYRPVIPIPEDLKLSPQVYEDGTNYAADTIAGLVMDPVGAVITGATVTLRNNSTGQERTATAGDNGSFSFAGLPPGTYTVMVTANGFKRLTAQNVRLGSFLRLNLEVGNISESVTVTADADQINSTSSQISNSINAQRIQNLPLNSRNPKNLSQLQAGAGQNNFMIDGSSGAETSVSNALIGGNSGVQTSAVGAEIGDLFEYRIEQPITVMRDRSALIPIVQTKMEGERVSVYNEAVRRDRPMGGMLLKNLTNLTLESGSLTVLDRDAYAGEALMERLKPKEQRLISYALDLGTLVNVRQNQDRETARLFKIVNGVFQVHYFQTNEKIYQISNQTERPKVLYIEYPVKSGWALSDKTPKPEITTQSFHRFRVELQPLEKKEITVGEKLPLMDNYQLSSLTRNDLALFISRRYIDDATRTKMERLIDLRTQIGQVDLKLEALDDELEKISDDQKRLRENIEALTKTPEAKQLISRYIAKADEQETRIEAINKERQSLKIERARLEGELALSIRNFSL